jgi:antitoxin component of MazEF toxin-antitoxin module
MIVKAKKYGNSLVIPLPKSVGDLFDIEPGMEFEIKPDKTLRIEALPIEKKSSDDVFWNNVANASLNFWDNEADQIWDTFYDDKPNLA